MRGTGSDDQYASRNLLTFFSIKQANNSNGYICFLFPGVELQAQEMSLHYARAFGLRANRAVPPRIPVDCQLFRRSDCQVKAISASRYPHIINPLTSSLLSQDLELAVQELHFGADRT